MGQLITSSYDPELRFIDLGEVRTSNRGYNHGLLIKGPEENVIAFEKWCFSTFGQGFRIQRHKKISGTFRRDGTTYILMESRIDFRDPDKYMLVKLQWW